MGPLRTAGITLLFLSLLLFSLCKRGGVQAQQQSPDRPQVLFGQSAAGTLNREFTDNNVSYLLLDAQSGKVLTSHWNSEDLPAPLGSLVKPFTALAYADAHGYCYPLHECGGKAGGCWQMQSHGTLSIAAALSVSCNSYFRFLASDVSEQQINAVASLFDLEPPPHGFARSSLIGLGDQWKVAPMKMARAYLELYRRKDQPGVRELIAGMKQSARNGTGVAVGRALRGADALVKTGTAECTHSPHAPGDGFVIALVPANQPQILLMIRVHGVPGAKAAETAGRMLRRMEE
jgi:cell division protein FtsI/penicillin-binding protein 2